MFMNYCLPGTKTAEDIAEERNIKLEDVNPLEAKACVIHGGMLKDLSEEELDDVLLK